MIDGLVTITRMSPSANRSMASVLSSGDQPPWTLDLPLNERGHVVGLSFSLRTTIHGSVGSGVDDLAWLHRSSMVACEPPPYHQLSEVGGEQPPSGITLTSIRWVWMCSSQDGPASSVAHIGGAPCCAIACRCHPPEHGTLCVALQSPPVRVMDEVRGQHFGAWTRPELGVSSTWGSLGAAWRRASRRSTGAVFDECVRSCCRLFEDAGLVEDDRVDVGGPKWSIHLVVCDVDARRRGILRVATRCRVCVLAHSLPTDGPAARRSARSHPWTA